MSLLRLIPDWARHAMVVFAAAAGGVVLEQIVLEQGVTGVDWPEVLWAAVDTGAVTTATGMLILTTTPATRRYGVGSRAAGGRHEAP